MKNIQALPAVHMFLYDRITHYGVTPKYTRAAIQVMTRLEREAEEHNKKLNNKAA